MFICYAMMPLAILLIFVLFQLPTHSFGIMTNICYFKDDGGSHICKKPKDQEQCCTGSAENIQIHAYGADNDTLECRDHSLCKPRSVCCQKGHILTDARYRTSVKEVFNSTNCFRDIYNVPEHEVAKSLSRFPETDSIYYIEVTYECPDVPTKTTWTESRKSDKNKADRDKNLTIGIAMLISVVALGVIVLVTVLYLRKSMSHRRASATSSC